MGDNELIERIRSRAYDPARRLNNVRVRYEWLASKSDFRANIHFYSTLVDMRDGTRDVEVPAGSPEAVAFFRDVAHGPLYPPVNPYHLPEMEGRIGCKLPSFLRRVHTEVADGGFGPGFGLLGLGDHGYRGDGGDNSIDLYQKRAGAGSV